MDEAMAQAVKRGVAVVVCVYVVVVVMVGALLSLASSFMRRDRYSSDALDVVRRASSRVTSGGATVEVVSDASPLPPAPDVPPSPLEITSSKNILNFEI